MAPKRAPPARSIEYEYSDNSGPLSERSEGCVQGFQLMIATSCSKSRRFCWPCTGRILSFAGLVITSLLIGVTLRGAPQQIKDDYGYSTNARAVSDILFLGESQGWMVVQNRARHESFLLKTNDGGKNWRKQAAPNGISRLYFLSVDLGWALRSTDAPYDSHLDLLRTSDGGRTWDSKAIFSNSENEGALLDLAFINDKLGWAVGVGPRGSCLILETSDGGRTVHERLDIDKRSPHCIGILADKTAGIWIYGRGSVLHSIDEGKTWEKSVDLRQLGTNAEEFNVSSAYFRGSERGWLAGQDSDAMILRTEDSGRHWSVSLKPQQVGNFSNISFWDDRHGCALSFYPVLLFCTDDSGITWKSREVLPPTREGQAQFFTKLVILKSGRGWAVRAGGYLVETSDGGLSWHEKDALTMAGLFAPK